LSFKPSIGKNGVRCKKQRPRYRKTGKGSRYPNCNQEGGKLLIIITVYSGGDTVPVAKVSCTLYVS